MTRSAGSQPGPATFTGEERVSSPYSKDFITAHGLGAQSSVSSALNALMDKELVIQEKDQYFLHDVVLSRWFQQQA